MSRRDVLKLAAWLAGGTAAAAVLGACAPRRSDGSPSASQGADPSGGSVTIITGAGSDPLANPALGKVFDDFKAIRPGTEWDIRSLPGGGPDWDRLARALLASREPVALTMINGQQVGGWVRDGLLADLSADPELRVVLDRVPDRFQIGGPGETVTRAFPLAVTGGVQTTGLYFNKALLEAAELATPTSISDLRAMVAPLRALGAAPLVHCSGDVFFNQILLTWILPMVVERAGTDPAAFATATVKGEVGYDSPEWVEALETILDLRRSGVLLDGSGGTDYAAMQQLLLQGKAAATFQGSWMLPQIQAGTPTAAFDLHIAPPPLVEGATRPRPIAAWTGFGIPAGPAHDRGAVYAFLEFASRLEVDKAVVDGTQAFSPIEESNIAIASPLAEEFLSFFPDAISPLDWLWEPEITAEIDRQIQVLVKGESDAGRSARAVQAVADDLRATGRSYFS